MNVQKLAVGDRVYVCEQGRHSRHDTFSPATVTEVARVYCRVQFDGKPRPFHQRFYAVSGAGEWPDHKGGICPYSVVRPERYENIMAERAAREAAAKAEEAAALEQLRALGIELRPDRTARISAERLLAEVKRWESR